jgi:hypothetical protein
VISTTAEGVFNFLLDVRATSLTDAISNVSSQPQLASWGGSGLPGYAVDGLDILVFVFRIFVWKVDLTDFLTCCGINA